MAWLPQNEQKRFYKDAMCENLEAKMEKHRKKIQLNFWTNGISTEKKPSDFFTSISVWWRLFLRAWITWAKRMNKHFQIYIVQKQGEEEVEKKTLFFSTAQRSLSSAIPQQPPQQQQQQQ